MNLREDKGYTYGYRSGFDWRLNHSTFSAEAPSKQPSPKRRWWKPSKEFHDLCSQRRSAEMSSTRFCRSSACIAAIRQLSNAGQILAV